jgi:SAM-dependent methyltransferase
MAPRSAAGRASGEPRPGSPQAIVAAGYDRIAERYLAWSGDRPSAARQRALAIADSAIPPGADVLELGCGAGRPMTAALAASRNVTGVDISVAQIALARLNVPGATFLQADLTTLDWPAASFDAVVAFYVLTHVPRDAHADLLARIRRWLRPGGVFLASFGVEDDPGGVEADWLGVDMYFSHFSARVNGRLVAAAGLEIEQADVVPEPEDRFGARFLWVLARAPRPASDQPGPVPADPLPS